jgi:hypothetical protein
MTGKMAVILWSDDAPPEAEDLLFTVIMCYPAILTTSWARHYYPAWTVELHINSGDFQPTTSATVHQTFDP